MAVLRKIAKTKRDRIRSKEETKQLNVRKIGNRVTKRRVEWNKTISSVAAKRIESMALSHWEEKSRRKYGRTVIETGISL